MSRLSQLVENFGKGKMYPTSGLRNYTECFRNTRVWTEEKLNKDRRDTETKKLRFNDPNLLKISRRV